MDNVYKKYLLIEDTPPLFVPDDASDVERDWWYQYGQFALQQPGYLGIPNLTLEKYREFDSILVQNFGLHITDIPNEQLQYLILSTIADPNYLNNPNNLPTILQSLGLPQDTPLEQVTDYLILLTMIMSGVWLIGIGAAAASGSGYTTLAQILNGTLQVANALDEIDDLISLIQNSEYLIDIISGGSTADEVIQWLQELLQNLIRPNLNNQDITLQSTIGSLPITANQGMQVYLTQLNSNGIPGTLYLYTFDPVQGIWILTATINSGTEQWFDLITSPRPGDPPIYNGQGTKGWSPGASTIGDPTGSNFNLTPPISPLSTDPLGLFYTPSSTSNIKQNQIPPNVNLEHNLPMLPNPYLHLLESKDRPSETFDIPQYSQSPIEPHGGPGGGIMTYDQLPFHLMQPIDRPGENFYGSFGFNPDDWIFTGIDAEGNQYFIYKTPNYRYYLVYDPTTGEWKQYQKPMRLKNWDDEGNPNAQGSFPPPYGLNVVTTFGQIIYVEYSNEYLIYNPQTGKYEPFNVNGVRIYQHPQGHKLIILPDGKKVSVRVHEYHPLLYDAAGNPRPRPWYAEQGLPWWTEPYWTHTVYPPDPLPNNWDDVTGWLSDFAKFYGRGYNPLGGQY